MDKVELKAKVVKETKRFYKLEIGLNTFNIIGAVYVDKTNPMPKIITINVKSNDQESY